MGVDVVDLVRRCPCVLQREPHGVLSADAIGCGRCDVIGVARQAAPHDFPVDGRTPSLGVVEALEDESSRALSHQEAVPVRVEGAARPLRIVVARGHRLHRGKTRDRKGGDGSFGTPRDHHVSVPALDAA